MVALCLGEALVDLIERVSDPGNVLERAGGSPFNVACGLARLEHETMLGSWWARDAHGALIEEGLANAGVTIMPGSDGASRTTTAHATLDEHSNATYTFDIEWRLPAGATDQRADHIHVGSFGATEEPGASDVRAVLGANPQASVSYDPNVRPAIMAEPAVTVPLIEDIMARSTVVKASDEDVAWMYGVGAETEEGLDRVLTRWLELGPQLVVVTRGKAGAVGKWAGGKVSVPTWGTECVDTVGAGDSFMAGLISGLLDAGLLGRDRARLAAAETDVVRAILERASKNAGITVAHAGAYAPTRTELNA